MQIKLSQIGWLEAAARPAGRARGQELGAVASPAHLTIVATAGQHHCQQGGRMPGLNVYLQTSHTHAHTHTRLADPLGTQ